MPHLLLIRHGLNDAVGKRLAGRDMSVHLNEQGIKQSQNVAEWLSNKNITAILSSPLTRALETAQPLAARIGLSISQQDALMEVDYGDWAGKTFEELGQSPAWKEVIQSPATMQFPHGESMQQIQERLRQLLEFILTNYPENAIVACFSHADIIGILVAMCMGLPIEKYQHITISPASICGMTSTNESWQIHFINLLPGEEFQFPIDLQKDRPK